MDEDSFLDFIRRLENLKKFLLFMRRDISGGVAGGDGGDFGRADADSGGEGEREHVVDITAGLDGGFAGIRRQAAFPAEIVLDSVGEPICSGCVCWLSIFDGPGGVGGRSPVS